MDNLQLETQSLMTDTADSGLGTLGAPSELGVNSSGKNRSLRGISKEPHLSTCRKGQIDFKILILIPYTQFSVSHSLLCIFRLPCPSIFIGPFLKMSIVPNQLPLIESHFLVAEILCTHFSFSSKKRLPSSLTPYLITANET